MEVWEERNCKDSVKGSEGTVGDVTVEEPVVMAHSHAGFECFLWEKGKLSKDPRKGLSTEDGGAWRQGAGERLAP